ncbi:glycosyltransferase family 4 protein [Candidatus Pelagibacter sp.]|nr:glycosyltransferase family 4 protein [Candidatus Pelagibacter sp.]
MIKIGIYRHFFKKNISPQIYKSRLCDELEKNKFKIIDNISPFYDFGFYTTSCNNFWNKPYFLRIDGLYNNSNKKNYISEKKNYEIYLKALKAKKLLFVSKYSLEFFYLKFPDLKNKIYEEIFPIGVPIDKDYSPIGKNYRNKLGFKDNETVIVTAAQWRRHKRLEECVKFFKYLSKKTDKKFKLLILGSEKNYQTENGNIVYVKSVQSKELPSYYRSGDIFINLCWIEAAGNAVTEAISCGLPSIVTNNGGAKEYILKSNGGIVSNCDKPYNFEMVDLENPPEPDYKVLFEDLMQLTENLDKFKKDINYDSLSIKHSANIFKKLF